MTDPLGQGAVLAPAGHPPVNEPGVAGSADLWAESESLGNAGTEAFDQDVGGLHQP